MVPVTKWWLGIYGQALVDALNKLETASKGTRSGTTAVEVIDGIYAEKTVEIIGSPLRASTSIKSTYNLKTATGTTLCSFTATLNVSYEKGNWIQATGVSGSVSNKNFGYYEGGTYDRAKAYETYATWEYSTMYYDYITYDLEVNCWLDTWANWSLN